MAKVAMDDTSFKKFLKGKDLIYVDDGSEGTCFKSRKDGKAYKIFNQGDSFNSGVFYNLDEIITKDDMDIDSFSFPEDLFIIDGVLKGYSMTYYPNNLFSNSHMYEINGLLNINFKKLLKAYYKLKKDVITLSLNHVSIFDMPYNLLFDGERLIALDTCGYKKKDSDVLEKNLAQLDYAVKSIFIFWFGDKIKINPDLTIEDFLTSLDKSAKDIRKNKVKTKSWE